MRRFPIPFALALALACAPALGHEPPRSRTAIDETTHVTMPYGKLLASRAHVTFSATEDGPNLMRRAADDWTLVCRAPCEADVDPAATYRVEGRGLSTSREIRFRKGKTDLAASPGSLPVRILGIVTTSLGGGVLLDGAMLAAATCHYPGEGCDPHAAAQSRALGAAMAGVGATALVVGLLMLASGTTTISSDRDTD